MIQIVARLLLIVIPDVWMIIATARAPREGRNWLLNWLKVAAWSCLILAFYATGAGFQMTKLKLLLLALFGLCAFGAFWLWTRPVPESDQSSISGEE